MPAVAGIAFLTRSLICSNRTVAGYLANHRIVGVRNEQVTARVQSEAFRETQLSCTGLTAVTRVSMAPRAGYRRDCASGIDPPDPTVVGIRDVQVSRRIDAKAEHYSDFSVDGRTTVTGVATRTIAGDRRDDPGETHLPNAEVQVI